MTDLVAVERDATTGTTVRFLPDDGLVGARLDVDRLRRLVATLGALPVDVRGDRG